MARDWRWRKAFFDGASFYVDMAEVSASRRIIVHEYPGSETHDLEDLGRNATRLEVTAYFVSETADADSAALFSRLARAGAGLLSIPMFGTFRARAKESRPSWSRQALNYVGFPVTFLEEGSAGAPIPTGLGEAILGQMGGALASALGAAVSSALAGVPLSSFVRSDMLSEIASFAAQVEAVRFAATLPDDAAEATRTAISDTVSSLTNGPALDPAAAIETLATTLDSIVYDQTDAASSAGALVGALSAGVDAALAARTASLVHWGVSPLVSIVPLAAAVAFAGEAARAMAVADYVSRRDAAAARTRLATMVAKILPLYADLGADATAAFDDIYGEAARHMSSRILDLAPVMLVEVSASLPSNVLAYRLYGDPNRGAELVARNGVATPCFMPQRFEAARS
jgi:prophage DNA circulation protein